MPKRSRSTTRQRLRCELLERRNLLAAYLDINGPDIDGDAALDGFNNQIQLDGFRWGFARQRGSGGGNQAEVSNFELFKHADVATAKLVAESVLGKKHNDAIISLVIDAPTPTTVLEIKLDQASVTSFSNAESNDAAPGSEQFEIAFDKVGLKYHQAKQPTLQTSWEFAPDETISDELQFEGRAQTDPQPKLFLSIGDQEIVVDTFSWNADLAVIDNGKLEPAGAFASEFNFTRGLDRSTAGLFGLAASRNSTVLPSISLTKSQEQKSESGENVVTVTESKWTLYDAEFTSFSIASDGQPDNFQNEFSVSFSKLEIEYTDILGLNPGNKTSVTWDFATKVAQGNGFGNEIVNDGGSQIIFPGNSTSKFDSFRWSVYRKTESSGFDVSPIHFFGELDENAPALVANLANGTPLDELRITNQIAGAPQGDAVNDEFNLSTAFVTSYSVFGSADSPISTAFTILPSKLERSIPRFDSKSNVFTNSNPVTLSLDQVTDFVDSVSYERNVDIDNLDEGIILSFSDNNDIVLHSLQWNLSSDGVGATPSGFSINAPQSGQSNRIAERVASGNPLTSIKIERRLASKSLYKWELTNVVFSDYASSSEVDQGVNHPIESFVLNPEKVKLSVDQFDPSGKITGTSRFEWDVKANHLISGTGPRGETNVFNGTPPGYSLSFPDGSVLPSISGSWFSTLPISDTLPSGQRPVLDPEPGDFEFNSFGSLSPALIAAVVSGDQQATPFDYNFAVQHPLTGEWSTFFSGGFVDDNLSKEATRVTSYEFADSAGSDGVSSSFGIEFDKIEFEVDGTIYSKSDPNGMSRSKTSFDWSVNSGTVSDVGDLGQYKFDDKRLPRFSLEIGTGTTMVEAPLVAQVWQISNPIDIQVGSKSGIRQGPQVNDFSLLIPLDDTTPGLIARLARGQVIDEVALVSRKADVNRRGDGAEVRRLDLKDVFVSSFGISSGYPGDQPLLSLTFNPGIVNVTSRSFDEDGKVIDAQMDFLNFIAPPTSTGITDVRATTTSPPQAVPLPEFFQDEQQPSSDLTYTVVIDDVLAAKSAGVQSTSKAEYLTEPLVGSGVVNNSVLFDGVELVDGVLILDYAEDRTGQASVTVTATDIFGLQTSETFFVDVIPADTTPPMVTDVIVAGVGGAVFNWTPDFIDAVDGGGSGAGNGLGYSVLGTTRTVPWYTVNTIYVRFSEAVNVSAIDLFGSDVPDYAGLFNVSTTGSLTTITMTSPFGLPETDFGPATTGIDKLLLRLQESAVTDMAGNFLAAEFTQRIDLLPGDGTGNGSVSSQDVGLTNLRGFLSTTNPGPNRFGLSYDPFFDVTANGSISNQDVGLTNLQGFDRLPNEDPTPPPPSLALLAADSSDDEEATWDELVDQVFGGGLF